MTPEEARQIADSGFRSAAVFFQIAADSPVGSPLYNELKLALLESLAWANDDDVIDALQDAPQDVDEFPSD